MDFVLKKHLFSYDCIHSLMEENPRGGYFQGARARKPSKCVQEEWADTGGTGE